MDAVFAEVAKWFLAQGTFAVIALVLGIRLYQREAELSAVQAARLLDNRENIKVLTESTSAMQRVTEAQLKAADASRDMSESLRALEASFERGARG